MKSFEFDRWDAGRLEVNRNFADVLRANRLTTFESLMEFRGGEVAKNLIRERITTRILLSTCDGTETAFYIKRHRPAPWKEYVKPLLRLTWPILGARNEWKALIQFHQLGIPTMLPVVLGESRRLSFVMTKSIDDCDKLSDLLDDHNKNGNAQNDDRLLSRLIDSAARIARTMHAAGMHHQDFYLTHLLTPKNGSMPTDDDHLIYVIDLGRVRRRKHLSQRWIVKDLAQLNYSAGLMTPERRRRFLEAYLGRPLRPSDRGFVRKIQRKSAAINRHSRKNRL